MDNAEIVWIMMEVFCIQIGSTQCLLTWFIFSNGAPSSTSSYSCQNPQSDVYESTDF